MSIKVNGIHLKIGNLQSFHSQMHPMRSSLCIVACPFGDMKFHEMKKRVIKCDFCDGDPMCVKACSTDALLFVDATEADLVVDCLGDPGGTVANVVATRVALPDLKCVTLEHLRLLVA